MRVALSVDEAIGLSNGSIGFEWGVRELYPQSGEVATWRHGETVTVAVPGSEALVLQLTKQHAPQQLVRLRHMSPLRALVSTGSDMGVELLGAVAPAGQEVNFTLHFDRISEALNIASRGGLQINGVRCSTGAAEGFHEAD